MINVDTARLQFNDISSLDDCIMSQNHFHDFTFFPTLVH